ncbi:unnamed protein product [Oikopleura dioica]|uniref:Coiled-coil domain-containing protein n=1 Tax=Oikopleura dioica TaxID=34765 RepID=E4YUY7_OIKDI|nr:unnamed protein product [Oikopleura dioica]
MERSETPANLPKNVEEATGIFRVGEDAELAYRLQEQEYVDVQQFNENERKIVAHDIRLAKQVQSQEEDRARKQGYIPAYVKKEIAQKDFEVANELQDREVSRFVKLKQSEQDGETVAYDLYEEERKKFKRREQELRKQEQIAKRDREAAEKIQKEEYEQFKAAEDLAKMTAKDAELARKIAQEEERKSKNLKHHSDENMAYKLSEAEKLKKLKEAEAKDRHLAKVIMEQDFNRYNQKYDNRNKRAVDKEDLLAIQQIEIDRGNYNADGNYITPRKISQETPKQRSRHSPKDSKDRRKDDDRRRKEEDYRKREDKNAKSPKKNNSKPPRQAENISKEYRSPRREYKSPAQYQSRPEAAVAYFPVQSNLKGLDSDGGLSTESFGEFYNPKEKSPIRRARSMDSILDTESVCADGPGMTVRIKPGVYQKTPAVQLAEREAQRRKKNQKDLRREQRVRQEAQSKSSRNKNQRYPKSNQAVQNVNSGQQDVHQMLYGKAPARKSKKKQSSDCSLM